MGCGSCKAECGREDGCGERKAEQRGVLDQLIAGLYPSRTWGQPDDLRCFRAGLAETEVRRLQRRLAEALKAPAYFQPGGADDLCSFIYVLCLGREPGLIEVREEGLPLEAPTLRERYLRLSCSSIGRLAAIEEVALELDAGCGAAPEGMAVIREIPLPGVFDPKLLKRFQKAVDLVQAHDIQHLDMGLLDLPASQYQLRAGDYEQRYGMEPSLLNFFFYAQPVRTATACYLPLALGPA